MLEELIATGKLFEDKFTEEYNYGTDFGIDDKTIPDYLRWLASIGIFAEHSLKKQFPEMTKQILQYISDKSVFVRDYNIIMGYLESVKKLNEPNKELVNAINDFYDK